MFLGKCLMSIRRQTYPNIDVIVVDNYSRDRTREIAEQHAVRVVLSEGIRSKARNYGASSGEGDFILSIDSDMELTSNVITECIAKAEDGFDAVIVSEVSIGKGFWAKCRALEKACYVGDDTIEAARFFKRSAFESVGGYDPQLETGEDWDLSQRIANAEYRIGRIDARIKHNEGKLSLQATISKKHSYGETLERYRRKHPKEAKRQLKLIRPAFVRNWRKLAKDPVHALGLLFMKTGEFIAGWSGFLSTRKKNPRKA
jgi:glycosyltransferase involved in cell wall biosynthesis